MFHTIDGLRGIGVIGVMLAHFPGVPIDQVMPGIYLVVDMFYLISGFVLSHAYQHRLGHQIGAKQFMQMRMIRIYPLYLLALGLSVTAHLVISWRTGLAEPLTLAVSIVASILILPLSKELAYRHHHPFPFNGASWTLFWEILINLVWAALGPRLGNRLLGLFVAVGIVLLMVAAALPTGFTGGGAFATFHLGGLRVVFDFFAGVAAYRIWQSGALSWLRIPAWASALIMVLIFVVHPGMDRTLFELVIVLAMPLLIIASTGDTPQRIVPLCRFAGDVSYGAYILNFPVLLTLQLILGLAGYPLASLGAAGLLLFIGGTLTIAFFADRWLDRPARRRLMRRFVRLKTPA